MTPFLTLAGRRSARWLETFKVYENKPTTMIEPKEEGYTPHNATHAKSGKGGRSETVDDIHRKSR